MAGSQSGAVITMKVLVEQDMIAEMRIALEFFGAANPPPPAAAAV